MLLISFKDLAEKVELKLPIPIIFPVFKTWDKSQVYFGNVVIQLHTRVTIGKTFLCQVA